MRTAGLLDLSGFKDRELVGRAAAILRKTCGDRELRLMHVCGTHENAITRFGIRSMLPGNLKVVAGPGCPVCVTGVSEIDQAIRIAMDHARVYTYGDMFAVPGSAGSLRDARAEGARVKVVYSITDALAAARANREPSTFFSIGFETTTPLAASAIVSGVPDNFSFIVSHRLIPPALMALLESGRIGIDGLICPGHVSTIIGTRPYEVFAKEYGLPVAVSGFEPLDIMLSLIDIVRQNRTGSCRVFNEYSRAVRPEGNPKALDMIDRVFRVCDTEWRGIGNLASSGLELREEFADLDAGPRFGIRRVPEGGMPAGCRCADVLLGSLAPSSCPLFGSSCTPQHPIGPCMVSSEGTCRIWLLYGGGEEV